MSASEHFNVFFSYKKPPVDSIYNSERRMCGRKHVSLEYQLPVGSLSHYSSLLDRRELSNIYTFPKQQIYVEKLKKPQDPKVCFWNTTVIKWDIYIKIVFRIAADIKILISLSWIGVIIVEK